MQYRHHHHLASMKRMNDCLFLYTMIGHQDFTPFLCYHASLPSLDSAKRVVLRVLMVCGSVVMNGITRLMTTFNDDSFF